jgi:hypothetical protein
VSIVDPPGPPEPPEGEPAAPVMPPAPLPPPLPTAEEGATGEFATFFHTDDLPAKPERVSHRGAIEASPLMQKLLAPVSAVIVVVAVILLLIWINGGSSGTKQSPAAVGGGPRTHAPVGAKPSHPSRPADTPTAIQSTPSAPSTAKTHGIPVKAPATKHTKPSVPTATAPVTVLNNSRRTGLAALVAAELRGRQWHVSGVGNQTHVIPVTTLYYAPGDHGAAVHLAHDFSSVQRIESNRSAGIHGSGLTLVVTQSWVL